MNYQKELDVIYLAVESGDFDKAIDYIIDLIDDLLRGDKFKDIDKILSDIDLNRLESNTFVAILTSTMYAKQHLLNRESISAEIIKRMSLEFTNDEIECHLSKIL